MKHLIAFFHPYFSDGGVERTNIYFAKGLIDSGNDVWFITTVSTDHFRAELSESGIELKTLGNVRTASSIPRLYNILKCAEKQYDKITLISCQYYVNIIAILLSFIILKKQKYKFVCCERNHFVELRLKGGLKNRIILGLVRHLYWKPDTIIANSKQTASDLRVLVGRPVEWIYNPSINDRIDRLKEEEITEEWYLNDDREAVIGVGRLSFQKDFETLIEAFSLVRLHRDVKLVILGDGDFRENLRVKIQSLGLANDVYLPGFIKNPYKFMREASVFVLSSLYEGLPNVLIEAMYMGVPVVSTDCKSGPNEILEGGKYGEIVSVGDSCSMANAIKSIFANRDYYLERAGHAQKSLYRFDAGKNQKLFEKSICK